MGGSSRIKQFKEAFSLIDVDGDGKITEDDLKVTMGNLGELQLDVSISQLFDSNPICICIFRTNSFKSAAANAINASFWVVWKRNTT